MEHAAIAFLHLLDPTPSATFNVEVYTDVAKGDSKPGHDPLKRRYPGVTLDRFHRLLPELEELNAKGAGIFVAVNEFDGQRKKENLTRVRGVHADLDDVDQGVVQAIRSRLQPTAEVQTSSPRHRHMYWLLNEGEELGADEAEAINRGLTQLGADRAAIDITRLLRLPGFRHQKNYSKADRNA